MGTFFSRPKQDICPVTVKAFYIVGTAEERLAKCAELIVENPKLNCRIEIKQDNFGATVLQLSEKSFPGDFQEIKARAEAQHEEGGNSLFLISAMPQRFSM